MQMVLDQLAAFSQSTGMAVYCFIFFGKILEVSAGTLRVVLINRGEKIIGSLVAIVEITLWLFVTGTVLAGFTSDIIKVVAFVTAFSVGNFLGSSLDEWLAFGLSSVQVVVPTHDQAVLLSEILRADGFGVTIMNAQGNKAEDRFILVILMKRKLLKEAISIIQSKCTKAVITVTDVKTQKGGYFRSTSTRPKLHNILK